MGPLAMYDNDRMRIDVDVAYEDDDERRECREVYTEEMGADTKARRAKMKR